MILFEAAANRKLEATKPFSDPGSGKITDETLRVTFLGSNTSLWRE